MKPLAEQIATENEVPKNWDSFDESQNTGEHDTNLLQRDEGVCQGDNKSDSKDSCDKLGETYKMETEECCPNTYTEKTGKLEADKEAEHLMT